MKLAKAKNWFSPYSITAQRKTTINNAFSCAVAPLDEFDEKGLKLALEQAFGELEWDDLDCVYCGAPANTWDHLRGLVHKQEPSGFGHQIGNLVPACNACNSSKGGADYESFLERSDRIKGDKDVLLGRLGSYLLNAKSIQIETIRKTTDWPQYKEKWEKILALMADADQLAKNIRDELSAPAKGEHA